MNKELIETTFETQYGQVTFQHFGDVTQDEAELFAARQQFSRLMIEDKEIPADLIEIIDKNVGKGEGVIFEVVTELHPTVVDRVLSKYIKEKAQRGLTESPWTAYLDLQIDLTQLNRIYFYGLRGLLGCRPLKPWDEISEWNDCLMIGERAIVDDIQSQIKTLELYACEHLKFIQQFPYCSLDLDAEPGEKPTGPSDPVYLRHTEPTSLQLFCTGAAGGEPSCDGCIYMTAVVKWNS